MSKGKNVKDHNGDEIVISGISGKFPNCHNVEEYKYNLYNKIDMVDDDERRWPHFHPEIPKRAGKIYETEKFDAQYFGIHFKQAHTMDPQTRIILEVAHEAVLDAGIDPKSLSGTKTGVYVGSCVSESEKTYIYENLTEGGFGLTGCSRSMIPNRISYSLGVNGPSYLIDTACSSSMYALDNAYSALRAGEIDAAIVGGSNLTLHPYVTLQFSRLGVLSNTGYCCPFDKDAAGYTRSEAVGCIFLQRKKDAKRIYGSIIHSKINCDGYKPEGITYPSGDIQEQLLKEFYNAIDVTPNDLGYVEAHSTGTIVGDPEECRAIDNAICSQRKEPLLIGSVKSNIGHSEAAAGVCSIVKACFALDSGKIPPNINFKEKRMEIPALAENRLQVVTDVTDLEKPYIGINSFGFGGANAHALLKAYDKKKVNNGLPEDGMPRLVTWAGRSEEAVNVILDDIESRPLDAEYIALLQNTQQIQSSVMLFRGYGIYAKNGNSSATALVKDISNYMGLKRPFVWVFSGMGSQWIEMGASLMIIPLFRKSIEKCHNVLASKDLNLISILTSTDPTTYDNILHSFVGIAAVQIGLVDLLRDLNIEPDFIIGHSVGELGCGYADGGLSLEQMILAAYYRGKVSLESEKIKGSMAAVGVGYKKIVNFLPPTIEVACHNSADSSTISGPAEDVTKFVSELKAKDVFAKEVPSSNIAYHSRYIAQMGPLLLKNLQSVIPEPKVRSSKWLSTSVPKSKWENPHQNLCSAEYHTNNLLSSVLFEETFALLPENAITIEIAPHGLLQAILKRSMPGGVHIPLTQRGNKNNALFFLTALGKLFNNGITIPADKLYPKIEFPVSCGTPGISSLVRWDHSEDWSVTKYENVKALSSGECVFMVSLRSANDQFISGHIIDGKVLIPASSYLKYVWETFSLMHHGPNFMEVPVEFEDVRFLRATNMILNKSADLKVMIHYGTGIFEITESNSLIVTGRITEIEHPVQPIIKNFKKESDFPMMSKGDFYKELKLRGYHYSDTFLAVNSARGDGLFGRVQWHHNWATFIDGMLQVKILGTDSRTLLLPTKLSKLRICGLIHADLATQMNSENVEFDVYVDTKSDRIVAGGVEIIGLHASPVQRRKVPGIPVIEKYQFMPHMSSPALNISCVIRTCVQLAMENTPHLKVKIVEVDTDGRAPIIGNFVEAVEDLPLISGEYVFLTSKTIEKIPGVLVEDGQLAKHSKCYFVIVGGLSGELNKSIISISRKSLIDSGYLLVKEKPLSNPNDFKLPPNFKMIAVFPLENNDDEILILFQKTEQGLSISPTVVEISEKKINFEWLSEVQDAITKKNPVVLYAYNENLNGIIGLVNCLRKEPDGNLVTCFYIDDKSAPRFDLSNSFYESQYALGMAINVYRNGQWGSYRHLPINPDNEAIPRAYHVFSEVNQRGDLSSLRWFEGPFEASKCRIKIVYSSINFRDVMLATGRLVLPSELDGRNRITTGSELGFEYSGIDMKTGRRVMTMSIKSGVSSHLNEPSPLMWNVPDHWSLKEAATVPVVYITVYYAFFVCTNIRKGKSILIHAGTGGVGLAAIRVALAYHLEVFTTCSTGEKKQYLLNTFPELKESHIGNSRDTSFESMIQEETDGKGVDFVLNSLSEDKLLASVRCLGVGGHFLEIGKFDMATDNKLGMGCFLKELTFHAVLADRLTEKPQDEIKYLINLIDNDISNGIIKPLPVTVFHANEIEQAFRYLIGGKHIGKVVVQIRDDSESSLTLPIRVVKQVYFKPDLCYIIPGGLGGFGLELTDWMITRGARKFILSSSRGITKDYQSYRIALWRTYGCKIQISTNDITTNDGCRQLLKQAKQLAPVGGIFNLAVALRDGLFINQTNDKFLESFAPKAIATKYLDDLTREMCPQLEHFVVFSSVSCGRGNAGQTNYGMANSVMERVIEDRVEKGYPGKAIQWGAVGEVGLVADMAEGKIDFEIGGTLQQRISSCLHTLDALLTAPEPLVSSMVVAVKRMGKAGKENIIETVMNIMGIRDLKSISLGTTLSEIGMDSLMAVEIRQTLDRDFDLNLTPQDLRLLTFQKLQEYSDAREKDLNVFKDIFESDKAFNTEFIISNLGDESRCNDIMVTLETNTDANSKCISQYIIIPGLEGTAGEAWENLGKHINCPTHLFQYHRYAELTSIPDISKEFFKHVKTLVKPDEPFYIIGYSFGSLIALELAGMLEKSGYRGQIILIDGTPQFIKTIATIYIGGSKLSDEDLQNLILSKVINQISLNQSIQTVISSFEKLETISKKIEKIFEYVDNLDQYSSQYLETIVNAAIKRLRMAVAVDLESINVVKSPILLIRPTEAILQNMEEDYGLSQVTTGNTQVKVIEGNHSSILCNTMLADLINEFFSCN